MTANQEGKAEDRSYSESFVHSRIMPQSDDE